MEKETKLVQMRLKPKTLRSVENLSEITRITNKSYLVAKCIELAHMIVEEFNNGSKVYIIDKDGYRSDIKIVK